MLQNLWRLEGAGDHNSIKRSDYRQKRWRGTTSI